MKALLRSIQQTLSTAGAFLNSAWQLLRQKAARLWLALTRRAAAQQAAVKVAAVTFWRQHQSQLAWSAVTAVITLALTVALVYLGRRSPTIERWFAALLSGTVRLPAGYALRLLRPVADMAVTAAPGVANVSTNTPEPQWATA